MFYLAIQQAVVMENTGPLIRWQEHCLGTFGQANTELTYCQMGQRDTGQWSKLAPQNVNCPILWSVTMITVLSFYKFINDCKQIETENYVSRVWSDVIKM